MDARTQVTPAPATAVPAFDRARPPEASPASPAIHVLRLQSTAGNAAVAGLLGTGSVARRGAVTGPLRLGPAPAPRPIARHAPAHALQREPAGEALTEAVGLGDDDMESITEQVEAQDPDADTADGGDGGDGEGGGDGAGDGGGGGGGGGSDAAQDAADSAASQQQDDVNGLTCIVFDGGVAMTGILADGDGTPVVTRSLKDLDPGMAEGIARAGVVGSEFSESAFKSLGALGFIDIAAGKVFPPEAKLEIYGISPKGAPGKKQFRMLPTSTKDHSFKAVAAPAGTYDTGQTVSVSVGGASVELKKLVEVTEDVAAKCKAFEQEHVDDTSAAFAMSFANAESAVNHFAGGKEGTDPILFHFDSEEAAYTYIESRLTDFMNQPKLGGKKESWVDAYKKLLALTISERDGKGTHSWSLARGPKVDRAAGTVTYQLNPPANRAGPSWSEIDWSKV